ncbi:MAG: DegT/DnrJ/EryC1/StrS family aminotransferase [Nitrospiraceae bacterium]|nr:DegT/DnrJ/EryC1/StrS family aminotransferase [Nitrospiraceae bacterium]
MKVDFFKHNIDRRDIAEVGRVLNSIFLTTGKTVAEFEEQFAAYVGARHAVGVTSCTAALHLSLLAHGIGPGDEVITTPMTFCATSNAILHAGATPVFVDAEPETGNMNAELIEKKINRKTRAVIPVHLYGQMCDMKKIRTLSDKYRLTVIEDAAHAIEAERDSVRPGELGDAACFSFYATKNITSGEGGAVATRSGKTADLIKMLRLHGIDKAAIDRYTKLYRHWDMPLLGWKYNMDNIQAALLRGQLQRIGKLWERRNRLWLLYEDAFSPVRRVKTLQTVPGARHARHLFTVLVNGRKRDAILQDLQKKGVGVAVNYRPVHLLEYYRKQFGYRRGDFPVAEDIGRRTISLPLYPRLKKAEAEYVIKSVIDTAGSF